MDDMNINRFFKWLLSIWGIFNIFLAIKTVFTDFGFEYFWNMEYKYITVSIIAFALAWIINMFEDFNIKE